MHSDYNPLSFIKIIEVTEKIRIALFPVNRAHLLSAAFLPANDLARFESIMHPVTRAEFLSSRFALHTLKEDYRLAYDDRRPVLINPGYVSISHSRIWAGAMFSEEKRVGLDVEEKREKIMRISPKFIREDEREFMAEDSDYKCQVIWSAKEAMYKLWKHGNVLFKEHLRVMPFQKEKTGSTTGYIMKDETIECEIHYRDLPRSLLVFAIEK